MKLLLLTASVLCVCVSVNGNAVSPSNVLSRADAQKLFIELTKPYDDTKDYLNNIADNRVDEIIKQINAIPSELQGFFRILESIQTNIPANHNESAKSLDELQSHLLTASSSLASVLRDCSKGRPVSSASSDKEEQDSPAESHGVNRYAALLGEKQTRTATSGSNGFDIEKLVPLLSRPVEFNRTAMDAVLARYGDNYITKEDAANAVLNLAVLIAEKHRERYTRLLPKMKSVETILDNILSSMNTIQLDVLRIMSNSENLKTQLRRSLHTIHELAQNISNTVQGLKCT